MGAHVSFDSLLKEAPTNALMLACRIDSNNGQEPIEIGFATHYSICGLGKGKETHEAIKAHIAQERPAIAKVFEQPGRAMIK